jgi:amidase/aspartyl-tRNA(Asn)/glutamyl-tRNA(Gln) amidotransferase subunit A
MGIEYLDIAQLHGAYRSGELSPVEVIEAALARIALVDGEVNAFVTVTADLARTAARQAELQLRGHRGPLPRLFGVPIGLKDLSDSLRGVRNTFGSKAFEHHVAPATAAHVQRLLDAGAIPMGMTNTSEFGHKNTTDNLVCGPTSTPFFIGSSAGGSSGGSAAAVAAGMVTAATASDGGGSIRVPAAACGVFGFKPTFGGVPWANRPNAFGTLGPFTHKGPLTRSVGDAAAMMDVLGQPMRKDPFGPSGDVPSYSPAPGSSLRNLKIACAPTLCGLTPEPRVSLQIARAVKAMEAAGAHVTELDRPVPLHYAQAERIWQGLYVVFAADTVAGMRQHGLEWNTPRAALLSDSFRELVERGLRMTAIEHAALNHERTTLLDQVDAVFDEYDLLVTPTNLAAFLPNAGAGSQTFGPSQIGGLAVDATMGWSLAYLFNLTGHPAASVPVGLTPDGLPVGMQIVGARHADRQVLSACSSFERVMPWADTYRKLQ